MKIAWIVSPVVILVLVVGSRAASAEGWSLSRLNPFAKPKDTVVSGGTHYTWNTGSRPQQKAASPLQRLDAGTKRFFANTLGTLKWKKPAVRKTPKKPWLQALLGREEPKPVTSFDDWWALKRMDP